jgi:hypothetical protein
MGPRASRSSILRGFLDGLDALDEVDVAKVLPLIEWVSTACVRGGGGCDGRRARLPRCPSGVVCTVRGDGARSLMMCDRRLR